MVKLFDRVFGPMLEDARNGRRYGVVKLLAESNALDNYCESCWVDIDEDSDGLCEQCRSKGARA